MAKNIRDLEKFKLLKSRVCYICVLRGSSKLKACACCEILKIIGELQEAYAKSLKELEKFKKGSV